MPTTIDISDLTNSTDDTEGTGIFDVLIQTVERRIESQHEAGRITGTDYATVYLGSMQSVLAESMKFLLSQQLAEKQVDSEIEKGLLLTAQTLGFASDTKLKVFKQLAEGYSMIASLEGVAATNIPEAFLENGIDALAQEILTDVGTSVNIQITEDIAPVGDGNAP